MLSLLDWLRSHHRAFTTRLTRSQRFSRRPFRPRRVRPDLEALEDRLVLSPIIDLGIGTAYAINNNGVVVGEVQDSANQQVSFLYNSSSKSMTQFGGSGSTAEGINDSGLVVGEDGSGAGFVYNSTNQQTTSLGPVDIYDVGAGTLPGPQLGISPSGTVVANGEGTLFNQAFEASPPSYSTKQPLKPPSGDLASGAVGINDSGQVAGYVQETANGPKIAAIYDGGQWQLIGTKLSDPSSVSNAINASGEVVGYSLTGSDGLTGTDHAFLYNNGTMTNLGTLSGYTNVEANGINDTQGWVVGSAGNGNNIVGEVAVLWKGNSTPINLNTLLPPNSGWVLNDAVAINTNDQIIGSGTFNGVQQAFLLNLNAVNLSPGSLPAGGVGTGYTQTITASGGVGNSSLAITSGGLPPGMTAIQRPNELVITGTPTAPGTFTFTVTATDLADPADNNSQSYTLTISQQFIPTKIQAIEALFIDGIELAIDVLTLRNSSAVQSSIAFNLPYASPFGQMSVFLGIEAVYNAIEQANQPPPADSDGDYDND